MPKIKNFLRIILRLSYHNLEFLLSNVILGEIELLLLTPVLLTAPLKVYVFHINISGSTFDYN